jgi:hypothetical protein
LKSMITKTFNIDFKQLQLKSSQIETILGYKEGDDRSFVINLIDEILEESEKICIIKAQYYVFDDVELDDLTKYLRIKSTYFQIKDIVFAQLRKTDSVAIFLCTAGAEIGIRSKKAMNERDFLKGYIYDVVGSEIVEAAVDIMQEELGKSMLDSGMKITNRYSPGYCGWDVSEQHKLFELIPENYCGIKLSQSALMDPEKSVSGIIGIGKNVKFNQYTCMMCEMVDCIYRRVKEKKGRK